MRSIASGEFNDSALYWGGSARCSRGRRSMRLAGLQVHRRLQRGSPDRCAASPPGSSTTLLSTGVFCALLPGAALDAPCPGYRFIAVCSAVARTGAQYRFTADSGPVARTDAQHRLRGVQRLCSLLGYSARCSRGGA
ncbi:hypothetical protein ORL88_04105 [Klebsiella oxytoca]|uniref:hypothetical protein n=1 Tax=Klebsiella oxytoca TaxID=571 RepID=UPI0022478EB9|nr:hypothetical protein [Klebsiella oxytoca]MCW9623362.1 hypothetical protein [Klebsiella oxytoca]